MQTYTFETIPSKYLVPFLDYIEVDEPVQKERDDIVPREGARRYLASGASCLSL